MIIFDPQKPEEPCTCDENRRKYCNCKDKSKCTCPRLKCQTCTLIARMLLYFTLLHLLLPLSRHQAPANPSRNRHGKVRRRSNLPLRNPHVSPRHPHNNLHDHRLPRHRFRPRHKAPSRRLPPHLAPPERLPAGLQGLPPPLVRARAVLDEGADIGDVH